MNSALAVKSVYERWDQTNESRKSAISLSIFRSISWSVDKGAPVWKCKNMSIIHYRNIIIRDDQDTPGTVDIK